MKKPSETQVGGDHYKDMAIQPHYFCHVNKLGALESNVVKYVCRHSTKGGKADLLKAKHYIELLLEWQYDDDGQTSPAAIDNAAPDYALRCICGWSGKLSQLRAAPGFKNVCPECAQDFKPAGAVGTAELDKYIQATSTRLPDHIDELAALAHAVTSREVKPGETWQTFPDLFFGWPYSQRTDADEVGELTEPERGAGLMPDHSPKPECCKHGLTICKVCEFGYPESI